MDFSLITYRSIKDLYLTYGYEFYTRDLDINLFGIRDPSNIDTFNDVIGICYLENNIPVIKKYKASTDPGKYYLLNPLSSKGTAILVPGQYINVFTIGKHKGSYEALVQNRPVKVYRDRNRDLKLDYSNIESGMFGINLHRTSSYGSVINVGKYSAGCQILNSPNDLTEVLKLCKISMRKYSFKAITYTLFTLDQLRKQYV